LNRLFDWLRTRPAVVASVFALVVSLQGVWLPSFWYDEVFTLYAISRPLDELLLLTTTQVDAVHLAYYLFMWFWTSVFGLSEIAVRIPSVIAAAVGTFFTALVAKRLFGRNSIALAAGIAFSLLPTTVMMTTWARSHALQAAVFAALLWAFVRLIENLNVVDSPRQRAWDYVLLGALLTLLIYLSIYGVLLIPVFVAVALLLNRPVRLGALLQLTIALAVPIILSIPLLSLAVQQRGQID
jgi:mannosyltransferase